MMKGARLKHELLVAVRSIGTSSPCQNPAHLRTLLPLRSFSTTTHLEYKRRKKEERRNEPMEYPYRRRKARVRTQEEKDAHEALRANPPDTYTKAEKKAVAGIYNRQQLAAIEAGEAAVGGDWLDGSMRQDAFIPPYLDDFSRIEPVIDKKIEKIRGVGQDYDKEFGPQYAADDMDDFMDMAEKKDEENFMGQWEYEMDKNGNIQSRYVGREKELDYFAEKEFHSTEEWKRHFEEETSRQSLGQRGETSDDLNEEVELNEDGTPMSRRQRLRRRREEEEAAKMQEEEDDDSGDELDDESNVSNIRSKEEDNREQELVDEERAEKDAVDMEDYSRFPKYREIRARLEAEGPMRRKFGYGATKFQREIEQIMEQGEVDVAPDIPRLEDPNIVWDEDEEGEEPGGTFESKAIADVGGLENEDLEAYGRMSKVLGQTIPELLRYRMKTLTSHRVVNQTRLGKVESIYVLVVAGNMNGMLGIGEGKAHDHEVASRQARLDAIRNMVPILRYENRTIYGEVEGKSGATVVQLSARRPGFGVRTNAHIFEMARCAGLQDLAARVPRSRNPMNMAKAVFQALRAQRDPEDIARGRGKKLVDVRKVYYSGLV